jgi:AraC-like DNA-binding protein
MIGNHWLLHKYGYKAEQFYSDIVDAKQNNARNINLVIFVSGFASFLILSIGRILLMPADLIICAGCTLFTVLIFLIGNSGIKQKVINPSVDPENREESIILPIKISIKDQELYWNKILEEFTQNKIYLNSNLNIMDVVKKVGTNRTYVSNIINQKCNQNFCSFVNDFRIEHLKFIHLENPGLNHTGLAQSCGFGSINSLKRALYFRTGLSVPEYKNQISKINPLKGQN